MARSTLVRRIALVTFPVLALFGFVVGWVATNAIERAAVIRAKITTSQFIADEVRNEFSPSELANPKFGSEYDSFAQKVEHLTLGSGVERIKIWHQDQVVWASDQRLVGKRFPDDEELQEALKGSILAEISSLEKDENIYEQKFKKLVELYIPIRFEGQELVETVFEVYENLDPLFTDIARQKRIAWTWTLLGFAIFYLVFLGLVWNVSRNVGR